MQDLSTRSLTRQHRVPLTQMGSIADWVLTAVNMNDFPAPPTWESLKETLVTSVSRERSMFIEAGL
jgi:hypothetical protein